MNATSDQQPGTPHYTPYNGTGPYTSKLEEYFSSAFGMLAAYAAMDSGRDPAMASMPDGLPARVGGFVGGGIGFFIDNRSTIIPTTMENLNSIEQGFIKSLSGKE